PCGTDRVHTDELDYELPPEAIAQTPVEPRDAARLLVDLGPDVAPLDRAVADLAQLLRPGDVLVVNETRVLPARVAIRRSTGGSGEVLLLETHGDEGWWQALCRPSRKLRVGELVGAVDGALGFEVGEPLDDGRRLVRPVVEGDVVAGEALLGALDVSGVAPLPPYITEVLDDAERYQTVFSSRPASAAAPTAGLHLTPQVLEDLDAAGVQVQRVELVVGLDTFRPITTDTVEAHEIHSEWYRVPAATWGAVQAARAEGRRIVAVGTTTVRALESMASTGEEHGRTRLFITPGYEFRVVDVLMTNFHLPRSSLLAMIEAFVGRRWRTLYRTALDRGYRFLSFGDAMLLERAVLSERAVLWERAGTPGQEH
ncbi:MAG: tRNA preQ1(34) S-adenosylmethionine ribosyltransferase-isomerase QueA, partial [Microthrixaceae bacterium]